MTPHAIRPFLRSFSRRNITTSLIPRIAPCLANNHRPITRFLTVFFLLPLIWRVASCHSAVKWLAPLFLTFSSVHIIHVILYHSFLFFPTYSFLPLASFSPFTLSPYMGLPPLFGRAWFSSSYLDTGFKLLHSPSSPRTSHKNESSSLFPLVSPSLPFTTDVESPPSRLSASIHALF